MVEETRSPEGGFGYGQYCPISRALEVLGERWALLVVRDLICGTTRFNDLARGLPTLSRTLLTKRLRQLERAGVVDHVDGQYVLTPAGRDLEPVVFAIGQWGAQWSFEDPRPDELDAELLVWWMHGRIDLSHRQGRRQVLKVEFRDDARQYWVVVERGVASICRSDPGYEVDLTLRALVADLYRVWLGRLRPSAAVEAGLLEAHGRSDWTEDLDRVLRLSPAASLVAPG